MKNQSNLN